MDKKIMNRLNGYDRHFKGRFLLLHRRLLSDSEFVLWDLGFSALADWDDKNHDPREYGSFNFTQTDIGYLLGWSKTKVSNKVEKLLSLGLWTKRDGRFFVNGFGIRDEFAQIAKERKVIDLQEHISNSKLSVSKKQTQITSMKQQPSKGNGVVPSKTVSKMKQPSSRVPLVSYKNEFYVVRGDEEYQKMWEENPDGLSIEDMKWIDANL